MASDFHPNWTPRERQVVALVVQGWPNKRIAAAIGTTPGYVKQMLMKIFDKTGCDSRLQLAILTVERGWL